jgi:hypothetical protein
LGYDSPAELQRVGGVLGVFASREEQIRMLGTSASASRSACFRHKSGSRSYLDVVLAGSDSKDIVVLVISPQLTTSEPSFISEA